MRAAPFLTSTLLGMACTRVPETPAGPLPVAELGTPGGSLSWRALDHLDAGTYQFPSTNLPGGAPFDGVFRLTTGWEETDQRYGRLRDWTIPLPFPLDMPRPNYAPLGAKLYRHAVEIPFIGGSEATPGNGWFIEAGQLHLVALEDPRTWQPPPELRVPEIAAAIQKRNFDQAGLAPPAFARIDATVGPDTRPALYVPAPGSARFRVRVPAGGALDVGVALLPDPLLGAKAGDGAAALVTVDGEVAWHAGLAPGAAFTDTRVDLSRWAGREVEIGFVSAPDPDTTAPTPDTNAPGADKDYDYVVWSTPTVVGTPTHPPRHVVVVGIDTLRWDALGVNGRAVEGAPLDTSPEVDAWARSAVLFDQTRAPAPRTRPSFRTAFTGRAPLDAVHARTLAEVLAAQGFRTAGFAANVHLVPRFGFNAGFEAWRYENGARAADQIGHALAWQKAHQDEDTYVFIHLMDPHTWYNAPLPWGIQFTGGRTSPRVPALFDRWEILQLTWRRQLDDNDRALIRGRYDGEVAYTSHALATLFAAADTWRGRTLTVLHADHGEEFWDHGGYEHNHTLYDELVRVLFAVRPPGGWGGGAHRVDSPVGLIDLVPTVLDLLDVPVAARPTTDGTSLRPFLDAARAADSPELTRALAERPLLLGHLMFDKERWGVVLHGWKYVLQTVSGVEEVYDLGADPQEARNRVHDAGPERMAELRGALARATGWPVAPGWRLHLRGPVKRAFAVHFDAEIAEFGIFDPEAGRSVRANLEWGESPPLLPADVGRIRPAADHHGFLFEPAAHADGQTLYVTCAATCPPGRILRADGVSVQLAEAEIDLGGGGILADEGTILVPKRSEADALSAPTDSTQLEQLRALGYIDGGGAGSGGD